MNRGGWPFGAFALLSVLSTVGCTTSGSVQRPADASAPDAGVTPVDAGADTEQPPVDSSLPVIDAAADSNGDSAEPTDSSSSDAADAADAADGACFSGTYQSPDCTACLVSSCCSAVANCEGDPACVTIDQCIDECLTDGGGDGGIADCSQSCFDAQSASARNEWQGLSDCVEFTCSNNGAGPCQ